jgi:hypothetical protein
MLGIALLIFALLNVAAHYFLKSHAKDASERGLFVHRNDPEGLALRSRIFGTDDVELLIAYARSPGIRPHPVLHFGEGESLPYYTVGIEGIRYLPGWSDDRVAELLRAKRSVWVFGGSTTFGHGVPDDQTVVAHLDALDPHDAYLNLSAQAYDSIREIDKLLYLLRKGYRPPGCAHAGRRTRSSAIWAGARGVVRTAPSTCRRPTPSVSASPRATQ